MFACLNKYGIEPATLVSVKTQYVGIKVQDPETGSQYTVKQYTSVKTIDEDSWQHEKIILKPLSTNSNFTNIILNEDEAADLKVIAFFETVID